MSSKHPQSAPAATEQPSEPAAPVEPTPQPAPAAQIYRVVMQIGSFWLEGELIDDADIAAIPGCDVERLLAIGALEVDEA